MHAVYCDVDGELASRVITMNSADPTAVPSPDPSEQAEPSVDTFGPPHAQTVSDSLHLWILIPGLIGLILIGELKHYCVVFVACSLVTPGNILVCSIKI